MAPDSADSATRRTGALTVVRRNGPGNEAFETFVKVAADGSVIYRALDLKVGLFQNAAPQPSGA